MAISPFKAQQDANLFNSAAAVTASDSTVLPLTRGLYIGVTGDIAVTFPDATTAVFKAAPVGFMPLMVTKVLSTGTAATNIIALY